MGLRRKNMRSHRNYERIGFIYYSYREECWWYEIVELSRKLVLNGCMVLVAEGLVTRVVLGVLVCFIYLVIMNHFRPYTCISDFTLQNICHIQLFITVFAGLLIKGKIPYLGFEEYWRPIEQKAVEIIVMGTHASTLAFGMGSILWEKFFSSEVRMLRALEKKNINLRKQRMNKWGRARENLMNGIRGNLALKLGGNAKPAAFGLDMKSKSKAQKAITSGGGLAGMDFAWPQQEGSNIAKIEMENHSSSESDVVLDNWSDSHGSGSSQMSGSSTGTETGSSSSSTASTGLMTRNITKIYSITAVTNGQEEYLQAC